MTTTMRAAVMRDRKLVVADVPVPEAGPGEVLVRTLACGICGSDLHALKFADQFVATARRAGNPRVMDLGRDVIMGHEFCAEIVEHGPDTMRAFKTGTRVCSRPVLMPATGPQSIGYSNDNPGGYAQYMRLSEALLLEVPNGLPTDQAALTEPMAVGARRRQGAVSPTTRLWSSAAAQSAGGDRRCDWPARPIVAASPAARAGGGRRRRRRRPGQTTPRQSWRGPRWTDVTRAAAAGVAAGAAAWPRGRLRRVGVPGVLDQVMAAAPRLAHCCGRRVWRLTPFIHARHHQ
jgi:hypothetical protein